MIPNYIRAKNPASETDNVSILIQAICKGIAHFLYLKKCAHKPIFARRIHENNIRVLWIFPLVDPVS